MAGSYVKIAQKLEKNCDHNLISSEGDQDTSACKISGNFLNGFFSKRPETPNLTRFTKSKWRQNLKNQQNATTYQSFLKVVKTYQYAKFQAIPSMRSPGNARKPQSLATDMRRLFYSTWPPSFSSYISNRGGERRWPQNKTGVVHRYQATVPETPNLTRLIKSTWRKRRKINRPWP